MTINIEEIIKQAVEKAVTSAVTTDDTTTEPEEEVVVTQAPAEALQSEAKSGC